MSFISLIHQPDPARRERFRRAACDVAARCAPQLRVSTFSVGAMVGVADAAFLSVVQEQERLSVCWGQPTPSAEGNRFWPDRFDPATDPYPGGYFAALAVNEAGELRVGCDRWGLYPLYYTTLPDGTVLIASSPSFMVAEPAFRHEMDIEGLCGLLLVNGLINNRSIVKGVQRLPAGRILVVTAEGSVQLSAAAPLPADSGWSALSADAAMERLREVWPATLRQMHPGRPTLLLLSGGLDSRMVVGGLSRLQLPVTAYSFGAVGDYDRTAAKEVARASGVPWYGERSDPTAASKRAIWRWLAQWSSLSGGFSSGGWPVRKRRFRAVKYCWSGIALDPVLGGCALSAFPTLGSASAAADDLFGYLNGWGLPPARLASLLRRPGDRDLPAQLMAAFRQSIMEEAGSAQAALTYGLFTYRVRFHLGQLIWASSFERLPLMPALEPELCRIAFHLSPDFLRQRAFQVRYLAECHPELARIPVDRNNHDFRTLHGETVRQARWFRRSRDPRRYYRIFDPEEAGWRLIRRETELARQNLDGDFDAAALSTVWPAADSQWRVENPFSEPAAGKNFMAAAWKKHLWAST